MQLHYAAAAVLEESAIGVEVYCGVAVVVVATVVPSTFFYSFASCLEGHYYCSLLEVEYPIQHCYYYFLLYC